MYKHRIEKVLILDDQDNLVGLITMKDIEKSIDYPLASRDTEGRLIVGAAIGVGKDLQERAEKLVEASTSFSALSCRSFPTPIAAPTINLPSVSLDASG